MELTAMREAKMESLACNQMVSFSAQSRCSSRFDARTAHTMVTLGFRALAKVATTFCVCIQPCKTVGCSSRTTFNVLKNRVKRTQRDFFSYEITLIRLGSIICASAPPG